MAAIVSLAHTIAILEETDLVLAVAIASCRSSGHFVKC
jgi:hypothetical protein